MKNVLILNAEEIDAFVFTKLFKGILCLSFSTEKEFLDNLSETKYDIVYVHNVEPIKFEAYIDLKIRAMVKGIKCIGSVFSDRIRGFDYSSRYEMDIFVWEELDWNKLKEWFLKQMELTI